jgi:putative phage-type endonuclease
MDSISGSPNTSAWHEWRRNGIGSSDATHIAAAIGYDKKKQWTKSLATLAAEKRGEVSSIIEKNDKMEFGSKAEPLIRKIANLELSIDFQPVFGEHDDYPFIRASFDGYNERCQAILEIKCTAQPIEKVDPSWYISQIHHQAIVSGFNRAFLAVYSTESAEHMVFNVELRPDFLDALLAAEIDFWHHEVLGEPRFSAEELEQQWLEAKARLDEAERVERMSREALTKLLGNNRRFIGREIEIVKTERRGNVDLKAAVETLKLDPAIFEPFRKPSVDVITIRRKNVNKLNFA